MAAGASGLGIGLDLLEVDRLERALARRPRLAERLFTEHERAYAAARPRPARHLAARFCAKEAVAKALGASVWSFGDVEVVSGSGPPQVQLGGGLAERARELEVAPVISLTHTRTLAGATALLRRERRPGGVEARPPRPESRAEAHLWPRSTPPRAD
ncbi:MAG TPA: holo-ACP synthase [Thermoleophilaceae bacterium]|nr:holo-ACP synthase [Thermoleophilaceae bacterium]